MNIFEKITQLMKNDADPPSTMFGLWIWLGRHLDRVEQNELDLAEAEFGEGEANRMLTKALVASGKWRSDDGETVTRV